MSNFDAGKFDASLDRLNKWAASVEKAYGKSMPGPCVVCGATGYPLSMGGPSICPSCDCGPPNPRRVREMREELARQSVENAQLKSELAVLREALGRLQADQERLDWLAKSLWAHDEITPSEDGEWRWDEPVSREGGHWVTEFRMEGPLRAVIDAVRAGSGLRERVG